MQQNDFSKNDRLVFCFSEVEEEIVKSLIKELEGKGLHVATKILGEAEFYRAEEYHQDFLNKQSKSRAFMW